MNEYEMFLAGQAIIPHELDEKALKVIAEGYLKPKLLRIIGSEDTFAQMDLDILSQIAGSPPFQEIENSYQKETLLSFMTLYALAMQLHDKKPNDFFTEDALFYTRMNLINSYQTFEICHGEETAKLMVEKHTKALRNILGLSPQIAPTA